MEPDISALEKLCLAYELVGDALSQAPELYDARLDQALFLIYHATKRARRIPRLRPSKARRHQSQPDLPF
jgi:hypothetical protein